MFQEEIGFDSEEVENEIMAHNSLGKFHPEMISLIDNLNHVKGPQINIENLHFDLSTNNIFQKVSEINNQIVFYFLLTILKN